MSAKGYLWRLRLPPTRAPSHTRGERASPSVGRWLGWAPGQVEAGATPSRRPGHVRPEQSFSKPPDPLPARAAVPNRRVFRPALLELASQYFLRHIVQFCRAFFVSLFAYRLVLSARLSTRRTSLAASTFSPALASPAAPLPRTLTDAAGFRLSLLLSPSLSRLLPSAGPRPSSSLVFLVRRACTGLPRPRPSPFGRRPIATRRGGRTGPARGRT